jgi:chemotaxis protein histidine kinase CheA
VFDKVSRVVRRLRPELGKEVRLEVQGADTELDKLSVEALADPLMHIVRNALDHAIEPPEERLAAGKPREGCVRIEAFQRGNQVVVAVADDGRGIDRAALRERAEATGLVQPDDALGDRELVDLVFAPGISTCGEVSATSGRGVGMDVVRTNIGMLGGVVDVSSVPGRGTRVSMTLPITLAIVPALVVGVAEQLFALPLAAVKETLLLDPAEIQRSAGRELLDLRGAALPLRRLASELGLAAAPADAKQFVIVLGMGDSRLGLLVDRLEGQQDAVIKPIHGPVASVRGIAGAADLGAPGGGAGPEGGGMSARSALPLDRVSWLDLGRRAARRGQASPAGPDRQRLLVFALDGAPYAVPVERVREIVSHRPITPMPRLPAEVLGVISLRGQVIQVIDPRRRLGLRAAMPGVRSRIVVAHDREGRVAGICVDAVREVVAVVEAERCAPAGGPGGAVEGLYRHAGRLVSIVDLDRLMDFDGDE